MIAVPCKERAAGAWVTDPTKNTKRTQKIYFDDHALSPSRRYSSVGQKNTVVQTIYARTTRRALIQDRQTRSRRIRDALIYSARTAMLKSLPETKIQIAWTTNIALVGPHQGKSSKKPDAAIYHARDLFTRYQDMYFSIVLCAGVKRSQPNSRQTLRVVSEKGGRRQIALSR